MNGSNLPCHYSMEDMFVFCRAEACRITLKYFQIGFSDSILIKIGRLPSLFPENYSYGWKNIVL